MCLCVSRPLVGRLVLSASSDTCRFHQQRHAERRGQRTAHRGELFPGGSVRDFVPWPAQRGAARSAQVVKKCIYPTKVRDGRIGTSDLHEERVVITPMRHRGAPYRHLQVTRSLPRPYHEDAPFQPSNSIRTERTPRSFKKPASVSKRLKSLGAPRWAARVVSEPRFRTTSKKPPATPRATI
jgi:hypothetical protein